MMTYTTTIEGANNGAVFSTYYAYNADGERVLQRNSDAEIFYVGSYHEKDMNHNVRTTYYYFGAQRVGMRKGDDVYWLHGDHLGSASLTTNNRVILAGLPDLRGLWFATGYSTSKT